MEVFIVTCFGMFEAVFASEAEADSFIDEECNCPVSDGECDYAIEVRKV